MGKKRVAPKGGRRANVVQQQRQASLKPFLYGLGIVAIVGIAVIVRAARNGAADRPSARDVAVTAAMAKGHLLGNPNAPVKILEFADFECPHCGEYATVTEPDVRKRIVDPGLASYWYYDFPLPAFQNSIPASNAAACAEDQGKFWEMHDKLFNGQPEWSSQTTSNPKKVFLRYATELGLNTTAWEQCYDAQRHLPEILANRDEGLRRHVNGTPTFVIGGKQIPNEMTYDELKAYVDSATALASAHPSDSTKAGEASAKQ